MIDPDGAIAYCPACGIYQTAVTNVVIDILPVVLLDSYYTQAVAAAQGLLNDVRSLSQAPAYLDAARNKALNALASPDCLSQFETPASTAAGIDPVSIFNALYGAPGSGGLPSLANLNGKYASAAFTIPLLTAGADATTQSTPLLGPIILVNLNASSFVSNGTFGNNNINAALMLHELGHVLNALFPGSSTVQSDNFSSDESQANTNLVLTKCGLVFQ